MPNALRIGLPGPLQVRDGTGRSVHVGGRQLRVLLTLLALNAGRVVPAGSLAGQIWPDDPPGNPGNALQTLVSRLRAELRQAGICDVIESHPAGYRLAVPTDAVDVMAFEALAGRGRRALADRDAGEAARVLRDALVTWRGQPLADAAGCDFADAAAAKLTGSRLTWPSAREPAWSASFASCSPPIRWPNAPGPCSCARCTRPAARPRRSRRTTRAASC
jgi:DNA-binding winged helix-turn-helix (wHTH) protein